MQGTHGIWEDFRYLIKTKHYKTFPKGPKGKKGKIMAKLIYHGIDAEV